jgi:DNA-directed RNA polymerase beta subunit
MKFNGTFDPHISISHCIKSEIECSDIRINCDSGRIIHPTLRVVNNVVMLSQDMIDLIDTSEKPNPIKISTLNEFMVKFPGVIEYIDTDEKYTSMLAVYPSEIEEMRNRMLKSMDDVKNLSPSDFKNLVNRYDEYTYIKYTHCEIHPSLLIGIVASNIPFADRNMGVRNMYQYSQAKQALGIFASNYRHRLDISYILYHSQRPIITTRSMKYTNCDRLPAGENAVVALGCFTGYNQEDSNVLSGSAIDRGLFRSTSLKKEMAIIQKNQATSQDDIFIKPDVSQVTGIKHGTYDGVNEQGYAPEETVLNNGDIILAKLSPIQPTGPSKKIFKDSSVFYKAGFPGVVDRVFTGIINHEGYEMRKTRTRSMRTPIVGDKFCSKFGQKGVNGIQLSAANMLFTKSGITIDILINPHCMPSRMTMGQLVEKLVGKIAACEGHEIDGTIFNQISIDDARARLKLLGYNDNGCEDVYNGMTGKKLKHQIYVGPCYYQRLKHMVADKIHCLTMDHEVLTFDGWKLYGALTMNDRIATLKDGKLVYENPIALLHFPNFQGKLYNISNQQIDLSVTDNHRMWVSKPYGREREWRPYELVVASELVGKHVKYQKDAIWDVPEYKINDIDEKLVNMNSYLELPNWVWQLNQNQCQKLIYNMTYPKDLECYYTSSIKLRDDFMRLCLHAGWSGNFTKDSDLWRVDIVKNNPSVNDNTDQIEQLTDYTGEVFCLQVPSEVFYVRRNGKGVWTGNSRCRGPQTTLTRQPPEGRALSGGLKTGNMELDALVAHGISKFLKERMLELSDVYHCHVCNICGLFASRLLKKGSSNKANPNDIYYCQSCKNYNDISKVRIPYAFKLLIQELMSINICPRIVVKKNAGDY